MANPRSPARRVGAPSDRSAASAPVFAYREVARTLGVPVATVRTLEAEARREYPGDPMLRELHVLRAVKAAAGKVGR